MTNVFVSYAREDKARIAPLVAMIDAWIGEVWWDDRLVAGSRFTAETERRLNDADFVIVVWTTYSVNSEWVLDEAAVGKEGGKLIPISFDGQLPPLGFRHIQTLDFSEWKNGDAEDKGAAALKKALLCETGAPSKPPPKPVVKRFAVGRSARVHAIWATAVILAIALVGGLTMGVFSLYYDRGPERSSIAEVTADLLAGRAADNLAAREATKAVAEIGASRRPEERAAFSSFAAGDQTHALDILENLASDLERAGDKKGAAESYTRVGAIALLVDQGRGLAARRKAFDLSPDSVEAFQGLFFDIFLLQGYEAAAAFGEAVVARPEISDRMRGVSYAHLAIIAMDALRDEKRAEDCLSRVDAIRARTKDPVLDAAFLGAAINIDWRRDRLAEAAQKLSLAEKAKREAGMEVFPIDVATSRIRFAEGDWAGAFALGTKSLKARRGAARFIPTPLLHTTCLSGLYTEQVEAAAPYCEAQAGRQDQFGGAGLRVLAARLAAARGDLEKAKNELAASRALAPAPGLASTGATSPLEADRIGADAFIAARSGDLDAAQSLVWRALDLVAKEPNAKSLKATALRLFGIWAIEQGAPERACDPLNESGDLYAAVGGNAGAEATAALRAEAGCQ